jgi:hypothetical protein
MPYIGNEPADRFTSIPTVQQFNGDGSTTAFTLSRTVSSDQDILVSVDGVIQDTAAYAVSSGTTLTFSAAPSTGTANIFVNHLGLTIGSVVHPASSALVATTGTFNNALSAKGGAVFNEDSADVDFRVESNTGTHALFVQGSDGNVGIGTSSPSTPSGSCLSLYNATLPRLNFKNSTTGDGTADGFELYMQGTLAGVNNKENGAIAFGTNDSERMRIDSSGRTSGGATTDYRGSSNETTGSWSLGANGNLVGAVYQDIPIIANRMGNDGYAVSIRRLGTQIGGINISGTTTQYITSSDYRLKENVDYTWDATTRLKQLKPARFNFIADDTNTLVDGFIAHEVSSIVPEAITGAKDAVDADNNPEYQGIDQSKLVPLLVKTIQELEARITALE